ncbi:MAG TPA: HAD family hydrolase [Thermoplasmata archaeon]|nr:HAD family hydrolase [Thermoplasmata archaeon]
MSAVTLDVWHTLLYLTPEEEERYYHGQVAIAVEALRRAESTGSRESWTEEKIGNDFQRILAEASQEAVRGVSISPAVQLRRAAHGLGLRPDVPRYLEELRTWVDRQPFKAAPGAREVLDVLRAEGYRLGVVGNTVGEEGRSMRGVLDRLGLAGHVEAYAFSDELPWAKPAAEIFQAVLEALSTPAHDAVHVGDTWSDTEGARRAGMRGAILFTGLQEYGPHYRGLTIPAGSTRGDHILEVGTFESIPGAIRSLFSRLDVAGAGPSVDRGPR